MSELTCDKDIFENGIVVSILDMPRTAAEHFCKNETERTGILHDWHYVSGRVVVKCAKTTAPKIGDVVAYKMRNGGSWHIIEWADGWEEEITPEGFIEKYRILESKGK